MRNSKDIRESFEVQIHEPALVDSEVVENIAAQLYRQAVQKDAAGLAATAGCTIRRHSAQEPEAVLLSNGLIAVCADYDELHTELAILHGAAHWLLRSTISSNADVWHLALALPMPRPLPLAITASDACRMVRIPRWAIEARLSTPAAQET